MLVFIIRGVFLLSVLGWYSATVWKVIDGYFQDQFRVYLQEEYRKHPRIKADFESTGAVDKKPAPSVLPAEPSLSHGIVETYDSNAVCPADIADACPRAIVSSGKPEEAVAGGTSEIAAAVGAGTTDKNAFPTNTARSAQESRKPPSNSDTRDKGRRPGVINQNDGRKEDAIEGSVLPPSMSSLRIEKLRRRRLDKRGLSRVSKEVSREISREKPKNRRVNTLVLTDIDFTTAKTGDDEDDDFSEFEEEEKDGRSYKKGILVSELPFKPKADIGDLDRVTAEEFCPLTLEDEASCEETTTWP
ncbi:PREDICTED: uncharacterized protein LOC108771497 [Cyphomyrmex costatus]|uniref:Uncharacterized protein n=1 Tax=Cyphomyrmex costatus TaxID=456900 RepID=A0A195CYD7_9HYME|nr:PREDICTED: uncharacterized protein LOC108771497 [Cyphomyrmex costatus]KYN05668.1 hypothetical protein ALC62_03461 [Cyphomyrmex costatus]